MHALLIVLLAAATVSACGNSVSSNEQSQAKAGSAPQSGGGKSNVSIDINAIFPPGPGRELVLNNCTSCHTFVPIVILQMTKEAWERNRRDHQDRVAGLSAEELDTLYQYVTANFNPDHPVPKLPKELLKTWTSY
jgi:hypothetical protein